MDDKYKLIRDNLPTRQTFFDDIRALTRYSYFDSWDALSLLQKHPSALGIIAAFAFFALI
jgi:hypothetical protein